MTLGEVCSHGSLKRQCYTCELGSELTAAKAEIEKLKADQGNLVWNLGVCSTFSMGYGLEEPFAEYIARPALFDVLKLAKREKRLREALEKILKHVEIVQPIKPELSGTWQIAQSALATDASSPRSLSPS